MKLTISDYAELNRLIHKDQGKKSPVFSAEFVDLWAKGRDDYRNGYGNTQYLEIEKPEPAAVAPTVNSPGSEAGYNDDDDVPF